MDSRHVSVVIHRPADAVYAFAADPDNLVRWAAGLASSEVTRDGDVLVAGSPMGDVRITFTGPNAYGVLDHQVTTPDGTTTDNPLRVVAHPEGSEVVFTIRQLALSDDDLERDARTVLGDLERLKELLEG